MQGRLEAEIVTGWEVPTLRATTIFTSGPHPYPWLESPNYSVRSWLNVCLIPHPYDLMLDPLCNLFANSYLASLFLNTSSDGNILSFQSRPLHNIWSSWTIIKFFLRLSQNMFSQSTCPLSLLSSKTRWLLLLYDEASNIWKLDPDPPPSPFWSLLQVHRRWF